MAKYTMELREYLEKGFVLFPPDSDYTFYDTTKLAALKKKIIDHYEFYEIGQVMPLRFQKFFRTRFLERIEYYNKLWTENAKQIDVFNNTSFTSKSKTARNDTPKSKIQPLSDYASEIQENENNTTGNTIAQIDLLEEYNNKLRDIDKQFINEFETCFMLLY